jgi:hypothetical protein
MQVTDKNSLPEVIFIGGSPRSGTTLLQRMMAAHPAVYGGAEFDFGPEIFGLRRRMLDSIRSGRSSSLMDVETANHAVQAYFRAIFSYNLSRTDKLVFCEKTPSNALWFGDIADVFPNAPLLLVLRDPRAIAASMKAVARRFREKGGLVPRELRNVSGMIRLINRSWRLALREKDAGRRIFVVHYEELVRDPATTLKGICDFVGINFDEGMAFPERAKFDHAPILANTGEWYNPEQLNTPVIDRTNNWKNDLTVRETRLIDAMILRHPATTRYTDGKDGARTIDRIFYRIGVLLTRF